MTVVDAPADVVVIGAGAAGGVVTRALAEAGFAVVCLERGGWPDPASYPGDRPEWELLASRRWSSLAAVRDGRGDVVPVVDESDLGILDFSGVGGGTILYAGQWPRLLPDDLRVRTVDGMAEDWPITWDELLPWYERTDAEFGVSGLGGNPALPECADPPLPPMPIGEVGLRVARAHHELGWHWWPAVNAIASVPTRTQRACIQRGACGQGCNEGAKGSTDRTHWPDAIAAGARLVTGAWARRIVVDGDRATGVEWVDDEGGEHLQPADVVLCAMNGVGTPRLLLASADVHHPGGLANSSGLVGRNLMLHPLATVVGVFDDDLRGWHTHNGASIQSLEFARSDPSRGFVRGSTWGLGSSAGPMRVLFTPDPAGAWGEEHHAHVNGRLGHLAQWAILCEDLPEEHNRVVLDPSRIDHAGVPAPRIEYRLSDNSRSMMQWMIERATESLRTAGATAIEATANVPNGHLMGTTRMGEDPSRSVVDRWGMTHDIPNLGVVDGSVFVTAGSANPTTTIVALAARTADRIIRTRTPAHPRPHAHTIGPTPAPIAPPAPSATFEAIDPDRFDELADVLIPGDATMPAPSLVRASARLTTVFTARPDLRDPVSRVVTMPGPASEVLASIADDRATLHAFRYAVAGAYYLCPEVRAAMGYAPDDLRPADVNAFPEWMDEGLLDHLVGD